MNSVMTAGIWAGAVIIIFLISILRFGKSIDASFAAHQQISGARRGRIEVENEEKRLEAIKRQNDVELDRQTMEERVALRQAELRRQVAEADVETKVTQSSTDARIAAEGQVVAARTDRRVQAVWEEPARQPTDPETMAILADGYKAYAEDDGCAGFDVWLGDISLTELDSGTMKALIKGYKASGYDSTFRDWLGDITARDGRLVKVASNS